MSRNYQNPVQFYDAFNFLIRFPYSPFFFFKFFHHNDEEEDYLLKKNIKNLSLFFFLLYFIIVVCPPLILTLLLGLANNRSDKTRVICLTLFYDF